MGQKWEDHLHTTNSCTKLHTDMLVGHTETLPDGPPKISSKVSQTDLVLKHDLTQRRQCIISQIDWSNCGSFVHCEAGKLMGFDVQ